MARKLPYTGERDFQEEVWSKRKELPNIYSQSLRDLVDFCLNTDPDCRPNIEQILRYPLVRAELLNILKDLVPMTYNFSTAMTAHQMLE
jgi:hypothetical protein